ncbi:MAG: pilus assembly protein TadG-related protein [Alphaproteobacteria bacterium]
MLFALAVPGVSAVAAIGVEFNNLTSIRTKLQQAADTAALSAARELRFANANTTTVAQVSTNYAKSAMISLIGDDSGSISSTVDATRGTVEVTIARPYSAIIAAGIAGVPTQLQVRAVGRIGGGSPVCVLGLETSDKGAIALDKNAQLTADRCVVYANSRHNFGLDVKLNGVIRAAVICTAGGKSGRQAAFVPDPLTNCPQITDPLASRAPPTVSANCVGQQLEIKVNTRLAPGTYCGGLRITNKAVVTLDPGIYVIKDGMLIVDDLASLSGVNVGFYMTGSNALVEFKPESTISLVAPKTGPMASFLMFEDRAARPNNIHRISSNDARVLLGTIYLPNGILQVDAEKPVADRSAYTIIVVRKMQLDAGPNLVMNANYANTDVPVPQGMGVIGQTSMLVQ